MNRAKQTNELCERCYIRSKWCYCESIPNIETDVHFVILRHFKEAYRSSNSGRLASLALSNSTLFDYGQRGSTFDESLVEGENVWLLFPSADGLPGLSGRTEYPKPNKLVVLDATWRQARRMLRRIEPIQHLPRLSLWPASMETQRIREKPKSWTMATIEAIARAVEQFEGEEKAGNLDQAFETMVMHYRAMLRSLPIDRYLSEVHND